MLRRGRWGSWRLGVPCPGGRLVVVGGRPDVGEAMHASVEPAERYEGGRRLPQPNPVHKITESDWTALVLVAPFPGAMRIEWVY